MHETETVAPNSVEQTSSDADPFYYGKQFVQYRGAQGLTADIYKCLPLVSALARKTTIQNFCY